MNTYPVLKHLPAGHLLEIGNIATKWSYLEWRLRLVIYAFLGIGEKLGRLTVAQPRATDYVDLFVDLCEVKGISVKTDLVKLKKLIEVLSEHRNLVVHGIWIDHPDYDEPLLQLTKGKRQIPDPDKPGQMKSIKRKIDPVGALIRLEELRRFPELIENAARATEILEFEVHSALEAQQSEPE